MTQEKTIPQTKGTYVLVLLLAKSEHIEIGKLGKFYFSAGYYVYVGSALGPGGIAGRINHHINLSQNSHWHIDYFKRAADIVEIWYTENPDRLEHQWADLISGLGFITIPVQKFGSSDCMCNAHFFHISADSV